MGGRKPSARSHDTSTCTNNVPNDDSSSRSTPNIVLDPVLAYMHAGLNSGSVDSTVKAALSCFPRDVIEAAKDILYAECCTSTRPKRIDSETRTATEADLYDIVSVMRNLDSIPDPPIFAVPSTKLASLPRSRPEELLSISIAERMSVIEEQYAKLKDLTDSLILNKLDHSFRLKRLEDMPMQPNGNTMRSAPPAKAPWGLPPPPPPPPPAPSTMPASAEPATVPVPAQASKFSDVASALKGIDSAHWQTQRPTHRPRRRVVGKGSEGDDSGLKGAPEPSRHLFISRVDKQCTTNEISKFLKNKKIEVRNLECKSHEESMFKSYKLSVPVSQFNSLFDADLWPDGVRVEAWKERRGDRYGNDTRSNNIEERHN